MAGFRGDDEVLDAEIREVERTARLRIRRAADDLRELEKELKALRAERLRRRARSPAFSAVPEDAAARSSG